MCVFVYEWFCAVLPGAEVCLSVFKVRKGWGGCERVRAREREREREGKTRRERATETKREKVCVCKGVVLRPRCWH